MFKQLVQNWFILLLASGICSWGIPPHLEHEESPQTTVSDLVQAVIQWGAQVPGAVIYRPDGEVIRAGDQVLFGALRYSPHFRAVIEALAPSQRQAFWRATLTLFTPSQARVLRRLVPLDPESAELTRQLESIQVDRLMQRIMNRSGEIAWVLFCLYESMRYGSSAPGPLHSRL